MVTLRRRVYQALTDGLSGGTRLSRTNIVLICLIVGSILFAIVDSEETISGQFSGFFQIIEDCFGAVFLLEYLLRVWVAVEDPRYGNGLMGRLRFAVTPAALIDLAALSPLFFGAIGSSAYLLRLLRLLRILRLAKIGRYSKAASAIWEAMRSRRYELGISLVAGLFLMLLSSACLYALEGGDQPEKFGSILRAMWWSISTLTVGYGDVYPITVLGKVFASLTALVGIGLVAVPTGIVAAAFGDVLTKSRSDGEAGNSGGLAFDAALAGIIQRAEEQDRPHVEVNAGELHRSVGGYPHGPNAMPLCCAALNAAMNDGDIVIHAPRMGIGASLTVRYQLPRGKWLSPSHSSATELIKT